MVLRKPIFGCILLLYVMMLVVTNFKMLEALEKHRRSLSIVSADTKEVVPSLKPAVPPRFLGFLRLTKTGSSAMLKLLRDNEALPLFRYYEKPSPDENTHHNNHCFFGLYPPPNNRTANDEDGDCRHTSYQGMRRSFRKALPELQGNITMQDMQLFTMIRHPWDRLVSGFRYSHQIWPHWESMFTPKQNECILSLNMTCYLMAIHEEPTNARCVPYQYRAIAPTLEEALELVESGKLLLLVNECFEASVRLLSNRFPQISIKKWPGRINPTTIEKNVSAMQNVARTWFAEDYTFYRAAVRNFWRALKASKVDHELIQDCGRRIRQKEQWNEI